MVLAQVTWTPDRLEALRESVQASPFGLAGPLDVLAGAHLYEMTEGGRHALLAVRALQLEHGRRLDVVGLASLGDRLQSADMLDGIDQLAYIYNSDLVAMCTKHQHIVRACQRAGWEATGAVMNKWAPNVRQ